MCGARGRHDDDRGRRCDHCGLVVPGSGSDTDAIGRELDRLLRPGEVDLARPSGAPPVLAMDVYTLRTAASARGLGTEPIGAAQAEALARPHSTLPARAVLAPFDPAPRRVTLGLICRESEADAALGLAARWRERFAGAVVAIDAPEGKGRARTDGVAVLRHPLDGDFAAQRNRVQAVATTPWVLQLDVDEAPDDGLLDAMDALTVQADRHGLVSIGLPRGNLVDGVLADLWPDVQYRLNRAAVRYAGRVHERPDLGGRWRLSMIAPGATLTHRLERARVLERSARYEAMADGAGRPGDEAALLRRFKA